ncbi:MAG TPA: chemotaxis protein CheW [Desulfuromonadales bacterium]|nr:chemotaxis protein CheW [Desulfuromonadales bacterium]
MDLAKIRKKSLQEQAATAQNPVPEKTSFHGVESARENPVSAGSALENHLPESRIDCSITSAKQVGCDERTPLDIILAGRSAAGCDHEAAVTDDETDTLVIDYLEFLSFRVSDETYGINIQDIKEIIKPRTVTEVPRTPAFLAGIISLRGTVIPIIHMRERLGLPRVATTGKERVIVIRNRESFSGLLVDEILQVVRVQQRAIEAAPAVLEGIDRDFVSAIGRSEGRLIIILNLETVTNGDVA